MSHTRNHPASGRQFSCRFPILVDLLTPEVSFTPHRLVGEAEELGPSQILFCLAGFDRQLIELLMVEQRYVEMEVDLGDGRFLNLRGRVCWIEHSEHDMRLSAVPVGLTAHQSDELGRVLVELARRGRVADLCDTAPLGTLRRRSPNTVGMEPPANRACTECETVSSVATG